MASLPSVVIPATLNLHQQQFKKYPTISFPLDKGQKFSLQKIHVSKHLDPNLNFLEAFSFAKERTEEVDSSFYIPLLQRCLDKCSFSGTRIVHGHIMKTGRQEDHVLTAFLIKLYAKCGNMEEAHKTFNHVHERNLGIWNDLMVSYVRNSQAKHAIRVFLEMLHSETNYPSNYTFAIALGACSSLHYLKLGEQLHAYIIKYHVDSDTSIGNSLCSLYSKCGNLEYGLKAFRRIREKDVISWTAAISACAKNGEAMLGLRVFVEMLSEGVQPNEYTLTSVLNQCCEVLSLELGTQVHSLCTKSGYESYLRVRNHLLTMYVKCGCIGKAKLLFNEMDHTSLFTWNSMIVGHAKMMELSKDNLSAWQSGSEALTLFSKLNSLGMKSDPVTFSSVLTVCSRMMALQKGEQIHAQIIKTGFLSEVVVGSSLINMYNNCGSVERGSKAFLEMSSRTLISWTSMITGFANHGWSQQALHLFEDMKLVGVKPNQITFVGVLSACGSAGMVNEAFNYFEIMQKEYKIKPVMDHYACLVDMFVRLGRLEEAFDFIKKMDYEASESIWSNFIAGCLNHGNVELGCYAAEKLLSLKPEDTDTYILLLKIYHLAGRFEDVSRVKNVMKEEKVENVKDWSWISIKDRVYTFENNDKTQPQNSVLCKSLEDLIFKAKNLGYEMLESKEISDEEKEEKTSSTTIYHSEKLAITFGLENLPNSSPIRVVKNTLMCRDSHNFIRYVSTMTSREIIVKDSKRVHKYVNGQYSCGNFGGFL